MMFLSTYRNDKANLNAEKDDTNTDNEIKLVDIPKVDGSFMVDNAKHDMVCSGTMA